MTATSGQAAAIRVARRRQAGPDPEAVARALAEQGVALDAALSLLARVRGVSLQSVAAAAGCGRQFLYAAARGWHPAPPALRQAARRLLGVDPWAVWEAVAPEELARALEAGRAMRNARQAARRRRRRAGRAP